MAGSQQERWSQERIERLVTDGVEESLTLEYKAAGSLAKTDSRKREVTKDVSAFANSAGGTIIYGVSEHRPPGRRHLPEKIDPIARLEFSKEWLEQVIQNIRPRIEGLTIVPVEIGSAPDHVAYVVEIPQGETAHQAQDLRYYRRFNFESVPMQDHEIRDIMNRSRHPRIEAQFALDVGDYGLVTLDLFYRNVGQIYADYVNGFVEVPLSILQDSSKSSERVEVVDGVEYRSFLFENLHKDLVQYRPGMLPVPDGRGGLIGGSPDLKFYVTRYDPILPGLGRHFTVKLGIFESEIGEHSDKNIFWSMHADNAPKQEGSFLIGDMPVLRESDDTHEPEDD